MGTNGHTPLLGHLYHPVHNHGVARMIAAGHIGGGDVLDNALVVADFVGAEALAHVAVQINGILHKKHLVF